MISFEEFRGQKISFSEQRQIVNIISQLADVNSVFYRLQKTYNNSDHSEFETVATFPFDFSVLSYIASDPYQLLTVKGNIHEYFHKSNIIKSLKNDKPLFVEDNYIRFTINNHFQVYHLLVRAPQIVENTPYYIDPPNSDPVFPITRSLSD